MLKLHTLKPSPNSKKRKQRRGRGNSSGRGNYSGRGQKGQRSRSGGKSGLKQRALRQQLIEKMPKFKGFKPKKPKMEIVNLSDLERCFENGTKITPKVLKQKGLVAKIKNGVKILGEGELTKKFVIQANGFSKSAKNMIQKAGGKVV